MVKCKDDCQTSHILPCARTVACAGFLGALDRHSWVLQQLTARVSIADSAGACHTQMCT